MNKTPDYIIIGIQIILLDFCQCTRISVLFTTGQMSGLRFDGRLVVRNHCLLWQSTLESSSTSESEFMDGTSTGRLVTGYHSRKRRYKKTQLNGNRRREGQNAGPRVNRRK